MTYPPLWMLVVLVLAAARAFGRRHAPAAPYHTFWQRLFAGWLDSLIFWPLGAVDWWRAHLSATPSLQALWFFCYSFAGTLYGTLCHARWGQTLGKWVFGVSVLDVSEGPLRPWQAVKRDSVLLLLSLVWAAGPMLRGTYAPPLLETLDMASTLSFGWFAVEVLTMLASPKRRALHDHLAGSVVVRVVPLWRRVAA